MEAKRQRVSDLLHAGISVKEIMSIVQCSERLVYKVKKMDKDGIGLARKSGSGGHNKKRTLDFITGVACEVTADPTSSMRFMGRQLGDDPKTIRKSVKELGVTSYVRRVRHLLTERSTAKRVDHRKKLINWMKSHSSTIRIFSDKKNWKVDQTRNHQNDRYLAYCVEEVPPIHATKHPASAMMLGVVASDGKVMPPYWFPKGLRVGTLEYLDVLQNVVKPWIDQNYEGQDYVWQQDSAPSHKANKIQSWCKENFCKFWSTAVWPPSSPDLNPLANIAEMPDWLSDFI